MAIGIRPDRGFQLVDGQWLRGLSDGLNRSVAIGITAHAGGTQAAAFQLPANRQMIEVDTVAAGNDSVLLPFSSAGTMLTVFNNGASTLAIYANPNNNALTGAPDVINKTTNTTSYTLTTGQSAMFSCAKNGIWAAIKTA